ncbi:MAG: hypothetical protein IPJ19_14770 [Planctomycetes bacterium]|nr:hypothetical protein [Planctomycetota bacterium]
MSGGSGNTMMPPMQSGQNGMLAGAPNLDLDCDTPPGWTKIPNSSMRSANFKLPGDSKAECYLALLGGEAGGLESNIDRWRAQISLPPLSPAEFAALPHVSMLGRDGAVVDFAGTWKGMSGTENNAGWRLVGVVQVDKEGSAFFKMYGPDAEIEAQKDNFLALARSFRPSHAGFANTPMPMPEQPSAAPAAGPAPVPAAGGQPMSPTDPAVAAMASQQGGLNWMAPGAWTKGAEKQMRTVTYDIPGGGECYVTVIPGDAGGVGANINRWREQLGNPALTAQEVEGLEHLSICGADGRMVTIEGSGAAADKAMTGAMVLVDGRTVFVKMTGPKQAVLSQKDNFKAFAGTLKESK